MSKLSIMPRLNKRKDTVSARFTLTLQILYQRRRSVVFTPYKLLPSEFDAKRGVAVAATRSRIDRAFAGEVNAYLRAQTEELCRIAGELQRTGRPFTAADVANSYRQRYNYRYIAIFIRALIRDLNLQGDLGTAGTFGALLSAFEKFAAGRHLRFDEMTAEVVSEFERFMQAGGLRANTITFYLSKLRAVYNKAVRQGFAPGTIDPFRGTSFRIEMTRKLAVDDETLRKVAGAAFPGNEPLAVARDLFLASFYMRGMSFVDMAYLRQSDVEGDTIRYRRRKTGQLFAVKVVPPLRTILDRYRAMCTPWVLPVMLYYDADGVLRPYAVHTDTPENRRTFEQLLYKRYQYARSHYLRLLRRVSERLHLDRNLTFNMARHTWASRARRENIPVAVISEGLGHTSEKTTRIYLEELEARRVDEANRIVTSF